MLCTTGINTRFSVMNGKSTESNVFEYLRLNQDQLLMTLKYGQVLHNATGHFRKQVEGDIEPRLKHSYNRI